MIQKGRIKMMQELRITMMTDYNDVGLQLCNNDVLQLLIGL